ncbi:MAG TPA: hypothetical protein VFE53_04265 [Mucilaginibacter sp.]|jgi:hypothetical protein|nr:hypothetical protein [Mucilaginibacter sp.]
MRRCAPYLLITGMLCVVVITRTAAQAASDSSSQQNAIQNTVSLFNSSVGKHAPLYDGIEYYFYDPIIKGNAYYADVNAFTPGAVNYSNMVYRGVPMLYDIYSDQVVILLYNHFTKITLIKDKVSSFDFLEHHFIRIDTATFLNNLVIKPGYYDELYNGRTEVLVKHYKNIQNTSSSQTNESYFNYEKDYFVRKNNVYYSFSGQGALLAVLKDKKKELQKYIRENQIKYRKNPEEAMVKIASYYDHLTN